MSTPDLVHELGFRVLDEEDDDPVLLRADGTPVDTWREGYPYGERLAREVYDRDRRLLQIELLKLQYWAKRSKQRLVIVFEGRDAAGKGGTIKRFMEHLNPRGARIIALEKPTEREQTQWYFQRYVAHLPAAGEMTLFRSGTLRVKLWFSVSQAEQQTRFTIRQIDPVRQWKLSPTDLASLDKWNDYTAAKEDMFAWTDTETAPWTVVKSNDKKRARINAMRYLLSKFDYDNKDHE